MEGNTARHAVIQVTKGENYVSSKPIIHKIGKRSESILCRSFWV